MNQTKKPLWITGESRSGKTTHLAQSICQWQQQYPLPHQPLILVINHQARETLRDRLLHLNPQGYQGKIRTPLGLIIEHINLFYPLIREQLNLKPTIPTQLRPETEQELATQLWQKHITPELTTIFGDQYTSVRSILDFIQLAGAAAIPLTQIANRLEKAEQFSLINHQSPLNLISQLIQKWYNYCLEKGFLTYGITYQLYAQNLLPSEKYQQYLFKQYSGLFIDDLDDFPSIFVSICQSFIQQNITAVFTYNETGKTRLGLNADPEYIKQKISPLCQQKTLPNTANNSLKTTLEKPILNIIEGKIEPLEPLKSIKTIITESRTELLAQTCQLIINAVKSKEIKPEDIAIIAPGLDQIARYTFQDILTHQNTIPIQFLKEKRPLITSAIIRSILTLLTLVYPSLGRLVRKDLLPEMLVILSQEKIDLVRANLLIDSCYRPDIESPSLLDYKNFPRWDRLTYQSRDSYQSIISWIENLKQEIHQGDNNLAVVIDKIIQQFFPHTSHLQYNQIANIKEFRETAQHFWEIQTKLNNINTSQIVTQFLELLRKGTITGNPLLEYNQNNSDDQENDSPLPETGILISTIYQYRSQRCHHRWQFWLDTGSLFWSQNPNLFAYEVFLHSIDSQNLNSENPLITRIIKDLLARVQEQIFLCHSSVSITGNEQRSKLSLLLNLKSISS